VLAGKPASGRHRAGRALELTWVWLASARSLRFGKKNRSGRGCGPSAECPMGFRIAEVAISRTS